MKTALRLPHLMWLGFLLFNALLINAPAHAQPVFIKQPLVLNDANQSLEIQNLAAIANSEKLYMQRTWSKLIHFELNAFGRFVSQVKDPKFFLSEHGYRKLDEELQATLWSFFAAPESKDEHAICKFPARLSWLKTKLKDHPAWAHLPKPNCYYFDVFLRNLNAESISFVFSSYYANNPGSAFGHTFFRVNKKAKEGRSKQELLDYGISYAANVTTNNPLLYFINGLLGGFAGTYASVPYYYKVREYNDYESRDLWSYELNLTGEELQQLLYHIWEVGPHYFDYYFFTQNCSYHMLTLMEAVSERIDLTSKVPLYVIPSDSVKALYEIPDLVKKVEFRPSLRRHFENKWNRLSEKEKKDFVLIMESYSDEKLNAITFENNQRKALFLDSLIDYIDMKDPNGVSKREGDWFHRKEKVLISRAAVDIISVDADIAVPEDERPDSSHPSSRVSLGLGQQQGVWSNSAGGLETKSKTVGYLNFRFAFHELLDDSHGLPARSQLEFGNFKFEYLDKDLTLHSFSFFNILQLNPLRRLDPKPSWGIDVGVKNMPLCDGSRSCLGSGLQVYGGYTVDLNAQHMFWFLPFLHYRYGNSFEITRHYLAAGYQLGYLYEVNQTYKVIARYNKEIPNRFLMVDSASITGRYNFDKNQAAELEWVNPSLDSKDDISSTKLLYHYFF